MLKYSNGLLGVGWLVVGETRKSSPFRFGMLGLFFSMATVWYSVLGKLSGMQFIVAAKLMKKWALTKLNLFKRCCWPRVTRMRGKPLLIKSSSAYK